MVKPVQYSRWSIIQLSVEYIGPKPHDVHYPPGACHDLYICWCLWQSVCLKSACKHVRGSPWSMPCYDFYGYFCLGFFCFFATNSILALADKNSLVGPGQKISIKCITAVIFATTTRTIIVTIQIQLNLIFLLEQKVGEQLHQTFYIVHLRKSERKSDFGWSLLVESADENFHSRSDFLWPLQLQSVWKVGFNCFRMFLYKEVKAIMSLFALNEPYTTFLLCCATCLRTLALSYLLTSHFLYLHIAFLSVAVF